VFEAVGVGFGVEFCAHTKEGGRRAQPLGQPAARAQHRQVARVVEVVEEDVRVLEGVARAEQHAAPAARSDQHRQNTEARFELVRRESLP